MNRETFWKLTSRVDRDALHAGDDDAAVEPLVAALAEYAPGEIRAYEDHLSGVLHALDGKVFADHAGENGDSGDAFLYCRCYVVANGKDHYSGVLSNPNGMPRSLEQWCEALLFVAARAWGLRHGLVDGFIEADDVLDGVLRERVIGDPQAKNGGTQRPVLGHHLVDVESAFRPQAPMGPCRGLRSVEGARTPFRFRLLLLGILERSQVEHDRLENLRDVIAERR